MFTYRILFLISSIVSGFVTIDLPKANGTKQVPNYDIVSYPEFEEFYRFLVSLADRYLLPQ